MKKIVLILLIAAVGFIGCEKAAEASGDWDPCASKLSGIFNECSPHTLDHYEKYDYGLFLDILYSINKNVDVGARTSWEMQRDEFTGLLGAVIKFGPKDKEE